MNDIDEAHQNDPDEDRFCPVCQGDAAFCTCGDFGPDEMWEADVAFYAARGETLMKDMHGAYLLFDDGTTLCLHNEDDGWSWLSPCPRVDGLTPEQAKEYENG